MITVNPAAKAALAQRLSDNRDLPESMDVRKNPVYVLLHILQFFAITKFAIYGLFPTVALTLPFAPATVLAWPFAATYRPPRMFAQPTVPSRSADPGQIQRETCGIRGNP